MEDVVENFLKRSNIQKKIKCEKATIKPKTGIQDFGDWDFFKLKLKSIFERVRIDFKSCTCLDHLISNLFFFRTNSQMLFHFDTCILQRRLVILVETKFFVRAPLCVHEHLGDKSRGSNQGRSLDTGVQQR